MVDRLVDSLEEFDFVCFLHLRNSHTNSSLKDVVAIGVVDRGETFQAFAESLKEVAKRHDERRDKVGGRKGRWCRVER